MTVCLWINIFLYLISNSSSSHESFFLTCFSSIIFVVSWCCDWLPNTCWRNSM